ncbi:MULTISPECIES: ParB/RepB/Spo0J family partition protein [Burkholderiales]|jgi:ParB family chromosome partitioning protein|uniref:ParB/RepB/Spo0J family partition protein n=1 Tax=Delftia tsuruhatensis TaxID=180282 RepID=A0AAX3STU6_9BURK|nr:MULTISPECIES: ParB/RepB/Spo0J family partition protein [Burkholderiales]AMU13524.1 chromosome partitioning protein ParB [Burkholderia cenocepacia]MDT0139822.1 ParB/RepB/Spo0J family partition protein [Acidovorax sp. PRC11]MEB4679751.1 ParB/RepB/Spo0J family partition protein [Burkholderia contaminans]QRI88826.1 ParB/RepB/Spo0J family partition protein [Delftia lacustris]WFF83365.1 ParB/RepB/Spo0J family partition protein [Delftia tsuruhatensis]
MNAVTHTEARAVTTAATMLQAADPSKHMTLVPLSRLVLRPTGRNVRKTAPRMSIPELAASIQRVGLLQNLIVILAADGLHYEVVAGGRRLAALKLLAKKHRIAKDWNVPCLQVADGTARTASLTENVQREAMHPADQFEAFAALVAEGRPIEDIAADFSVTPLVVQRRLKLANVSPRLMDDYRADAVTLDQLMALAITDDHAAQEAAFYDAPQWQRNPSALRERLTEREIGASHPLVRFVGLDAYEAAGGGIRRDLFAEGDAGVYVSDTALLETLVREKLESYASTLRAEGWAWVDATPAMTYADLQAFQRAPRERRTPNKREAQRIERLQEKMQAVGVAVDAAMDADDEDKAEALQEEGEVLGEQLQALEEGLQGYSANVKAAAGAIVTIDRNGETVIHRGLLREAEAKALRTLEKLRQGFAEGEGANDDDGEAAEEAQAPAVSDRLAQRLSAHRTAALQIEVARHPQVALAALVHGMVQSVLQGRYYGHDMPMGVRFTLQDRLEGMAPDWPESPAALALRELQQVWGDKLPEDSAALFAALLAMEQGELVQLLAVCVAATVDVVTPRATPHQPGEELAQAVGLDMASWWQPCAEGYFRHVPKAAILQAVGEFAPAHVARLGKLKKADIASEAERLAKGTGWMPAIFKAEGPQEVGPEEGAQASASAMDELAEALAA